MPLGKIVILDGAGASDGDLAPVLDELKRALARDGSEIETFPLQEMKLAHCLGCFGCWLKTPGMCVENDAGRQIARAMIQSTVTVLFTPVTFGGYSPELKRMVDRFIQLASPFFQMEHGEVHHPPRYTRRPRLVMVGVQREPNQHEADVFKTLAGRNAINFHPPSYAAEVVDAAEPAEALRRKFEALVTRQDALPYGEAAARVMPPVVTEMAHSDVPKQVLLIVGSPKAGSNSASAVLGNHILGRLASQGWATEAMTLRPVLHGRQGAEALVNSVRRAGLILLVSPLYVDSLPHLVTTALKLIAQDRRQAEAPARQRLLAVVNSGFPEKHQSAVALAICREFAAQTGMEWCGGLALGGGGIVGDRELTAPDRGTPPLTRIVQSLDLTAAALAQGRPAPEEAQRLLAKAPVRFFPAPLWNRLYIFIGGRGLAKQAALNGVARDQLMAQPYAV